MLRGPYHSGAVTHDDPQQQHQQQHADDQQHGQDYQPWEHHDQPPQHQHDAAYDDGSYPQHTDGSYDQYGQYDQQQPYDDQQQQQQQYGQDGYGQDGGYDPNGSYDTNGYADPSGGGGYPPAETDGYGHDDAAAQYHDQQQYDQQAYDDQQGYADTNGYDEHHHQQQHGDETGGGGDGLPDGFAPVPSLPQVYKWMVASIGESMSQSMTMSMRVSMPLDAIQGVAAGIALRDPSEEGQTELFKNLWITAHTRHFHGVAVLAWARLQQNDACNFECCPKMIVGKTEVRWKQSAEELAQYEDGDPYKVTYLSLPASEYIDRALAENHGVLSEQSITPFVGGQPQQGISDYEFAFSPYFLPTMKEVYKYILRVYTHLYLYHIDQLPSTFASFLSPPPPPASESGAARAPQPASLVPLEKFQFHLAYFLHFGLSYHLVGHEQVDGLGVAMKYLVWNMADMEEMVPQSFRDAVARGEAAPPQTPAAAASGRPQTQQSTQQQAQASMSPLQLRQPSVATGLSSSNPLLQSSSAGSSSSDNTPLMVMGANGMPVMAPDPAAAALAEQNKKLQQLQEELERMRLAAKEKDEADKKAIALAAVAAAAAAHAASPAVQFASPAMGPQSSPFGQQQSGGGGGGGFSLASAKAVSNIDPALIALKRAELIKKAIAPFIAHNLAIAKVEQDLRESNFPPGYTPSPGYGPNGYVLPAAAAGPKSALSLMAMNRGASNGGGYELSHDNSPKILSPSSREREKSGGGGGSVPSSLTRPKSVLLEDAAFDDDDHKHGGSHSKRSSSKSGHKSSRHKSSKKRDDEASVSGSHRSRSSKSKHSESSGDDSDTPDEHSHNDSTKSLSSAHAHSRPTLSQMGGGGGGGGTQQQQQQPDPSPTLAPAPAPDGRRPIPRRPMPTRQPGPGREPSCGQRLCF